jgi:hypothetical protein
VADTKDFEEAVTLTRLSRKWLSGFAHAKYIETHSYSCEFGKCHSEAKDRDVRDRRAFG